jgi:hypothetical protein
MIMVLTWVKLLLTFLSQRSPLSIKRLLKVLCRRLGRGYKAVTSLATLGQIKRRLFRTSTFK